MACFAVMVVAPWLQNKLGFDSGTNILNASVILAFMALPTIISVAEDALSAIGREIREASYALGATRAETLIKVVLPAAHSGIVAAVILGMMRAIGETMVVWMASGNASKIAFPVVGLVSIRTDDDRHHCRRVGRSSQEHGPLLCALCIWSAAPGRYIWIESGQ